VTRTPANALISLLAAFAAWHAPLAGAQAPDADTLRNALEEIAGSVASRFDCRVTIRGNPIFQELSGSWVAFFMADGPDCDAASRALTEGARPLGLLVARRPTLEQVGEQIRGILAAVRGGFDCRIVPRGDPSFQDASGDWLVMYLATGSGCDAAAEELADLGRERQILLVRTVARQDLIR
jgi:hypothetical protein